MKTKNILKNISFAVLVILITFSITKAGDLFPSGTSILPTFYTLGDIYDKLTDNTTSADEGDHDLTSSATPASTFHTLKDIYEAIPTIDADKMLTTADYMGVQGTIVSIGAVTITPSTTAQTIIAGYHNGSGTVSGDTDLISSNILSGVNIFGVSGSAVSGADLSNMFNGSLTPYEGSGDHPGGATSTGGVDDYNNSDNPPADRYEVEWIQCTLGNNYCGTGDNFAQAKDNNTNLIWALPCAGAGCSSNSTTTQNYYTWDGSDGWDVSNNGMTAQQLCSSLGSGWYLPHQKQLMQAYIDGSYGNLEFPGTYDYYWSATTVSDAPGIAWIVLLSNGYTTNYVKFVTYRVRCVRLAN
ncbi:MAG: DUF1566 domain-containing protein [Patescibacteria group bacterium]|nr:DUF1566 domain-containing protein [Patescibacteria group bacterium]